MKVQVYTEESYPGFEPGTLISNPFTPVVGIV